MNNYIKVGESILNKYFDHNCKNSLDDAEYIPIVKIIIHGIEESMLTENIDKKEIMKVKNKLKDFNRKLYTDLWLKNTRENEGDDIDEEEESNSAKYYFDYVYKHEEHPH
jgi:hypothetical protein